MVFHLTFSIAERSCSKTGVLEVGAKVEAMEESLHWLAPLAFLSLPSFSTQDILPMVDWAISHQS